MRPVRAALTALVVTGVVACSPADVPGPNATDPDGSPTIAGPETTGGAEAAPVRLPRGAGTVVAAGLQQPWSLVFVDGQPLFTQRDRATISTIVDGSVTEVARVPGVVPRGEGGLLGLAWAPGLPDRLFAYLTTASDNRVVSMPLTRTGTTITLGAPRPIVTGIPRARNHNGGRIAFGPDGKLYIGTGDAEDKPRAQRRDDLGGKILRVDPDGSVPPDNPFGTPVWSWGHRNVQGFDWAADGTMWASELGQDAWDELNVIVRGGNYGWPDVEGRDGAASGTVAPVTVWRPADASPSGLLHRDGTLYVAALRGQRMWVVPADRRAASGGGVAALETDGPGRLRDIVAAPDGTIWVLTSNGADDRIVSFPIR